MAAVKRIRAALIGSGSISKTYLTNITKHFHIIEMVGCSDIIPERSAKRAEEFQIKQMTNEEILADPSIEIVINTTYPLSHYEVTKAALLAGKHVYMEKMLAVTLEEGKELVDIAREKRLLLTVAPDTFLGGGWQSARLAIDTGLIGEPVTATCVCVRAYTGNTAEKQTDRLGFVFSAGGGIPFDMGGYYLHNLIHLFGSIERVAGFVKTHNSPRTQRNPRHPHYGETFTIDSPNVLVGSLSFQSGLLASLTVMSEAPIFTQPVFEIQGTEGILTCYDPNDFIGELVLTRPGNEPKSLAITHGYPFECRGLGVADMAYALRNNRRPRAHCDMGYHAFEAVWGIIKSCETNCVYTMQSICDRPRPIRSGQIGGTAQESFLDD